MQPTKKKEEEEEMSGDWKGMEERLTLIFISGN
jgi:hypothetical protein